MVAELGLQAELYRLAKNARNANFKEYVRKGSGRREIREDSESKSTTADQVDNLLEIVTGSGNIRCRHGLDVSCQQRSCN
jgi:hypothetical protein